MIIKEFLPNPAGSDKEGEYIKIFNDGGAAADLSGWKLKDAGGASFNLSGNLGPNQELVLPHSLTKISLNNNGEKLFLYDSVGKLADELSYIGQASEGQVITKDNKQLAIDNEIITDISAKDYRINNVLFVDFLIAAILAGLGLYIILQLEKKLNIKLF